MAIKLIANYSKRLGLPGYSSHQFSVSIETELLATDDIPQESARLYHMLQSNVDEQILQTGFVPPADYGMDSPSGNAHHDDSAAPSSPAHQSSQPSQWQRGPAWKCSEKQKDFILKIVEEHQLDKHLIESLAQERFGKGVRLLNKMEASGLIDELLETYGQTTRPANSSGNRRDATAYSSPQKGRAA